MSVIPGTKLRQSMEVRRTAWLNRGAASWEKGRVVGSKLEM